MRDLLIRAFAWIDSKWWVKTFIIPLAVTLPPIMIAQTKWDAELERYFKDHPSLRFIFVGWPAVVIGISALYQKLKPPRVVTTTDLSTLLEVLRRIVGAKVDRFAEALMRFRGDSENARARIVFTTITKPDEQLKAIIAGVYQFFEATRPTAIPMPELNIRVALAKMGEKHIERFELFFPDGQNPRSRVNDLQRDECGFSRAKAAGDIVVVEDFVSESTGGPTRCFVITDDRRRTEGGAMICYPVIIRGTNEIPFVISICASKPKYFKKGDSEYYKRILAHFEQRIVLEYCLKSLKGIVK